MAVGANGEASSTTGINGDAGDLSYAQSGAVYVFSRTGTAWAQEAYLKASNTHAHTLFGLSVAMSSDGATIVAGSPSESSAATGIDGDGGDTSATHAGAAYAFTRSAAGAWTQDAYVKASNTRAFSQFGWSVALSPEGHALVIGAYTDPYAGAGVNGPLGDASVTDEGAAYVFARAGAWTQIALLKPPLPKPNVDFGDSVAASQLATTIAVGGSADPSAATGVNGDAGDTGAQNAGAVYVFR
jgi:hypothetical protein